MFGEMAHQRKAAPYSAPLEERSSSDPATTDAVGFKAAWAASDCEIRTCLCFIFRGGCQIPEGLLIQREFLQIGFHFGSLP